LSVARGISWFIGVFKLEALAIAPAKFNVADVRLESFRAGGPGGQHQNKTESAVRAVHKPTGLAVVVRDGRSQHRNKIIAIERLRAELAAITDRQNVQSGHNLLERGRPVRTFKGEQFQLR
jgi:peptide chain release factor